MMLEREILEIVPGRHQKLEDLEGCSNVPNTFIIAHREEIFSLINKIPNFVNLAAEMEKNTERFQFLLDLYQEQPTLLDSCLGTMIQKLLYYVKLLEDGQTRFDQASCIAFSFMSHIAKVRGYKAFLSFLPHEVFYLEKVLNSLERYAHSTARDVCYILLLWMIILCKNPFDLSRFDVTAKGNRNTIHRIIDVATPYLYQNINKCQRAAALLLASILTREEARQSLLPSAVISCVEVLAGCSERKSTDTVFTGSLFFLAALFKKGRREDLIALAKPVLDLMNRISSLADTDIIVKKLSIKLIQRLGMVFLKPKVASWRYERGNRLLTLNEKSATINELHSNHASFLSSKEILEKSATSHIVDYYIPQEELEIVLNWILQALSDRDTEVRWTGAKGIGRVVSRLPRGLAEDVLFSIFSNNFNSNAGMAAWHGGCLAIAELSKRGFLMVERLGNVLQIILQALVFEEPQGGHALGANVRDAACYICWALARTFRPSDLAPYVDQIAVCLTCVAIFDREINVRRAASAAFQEIVGRQGCFPSGIDILTKMDYHGVGSRQHAYLNISFEVSKNPLYAKALIEHLINYKIGHWDEEIRFLAAEALRRLCVADPTVVANAIDHQISFLMNDQALIKRQGGILAAAAAISGLFSIGFPIKDEWLNLALQMSSNVMGFFDKQRRMNGTCLIKRGMNNFIHHLSGVLPVDRIPANEWFTILEHNFADENAVIRNETASAASIFFTYLTSTTYSSFLINRIRHFYLTEIMCARMEYQREGFATLLGVLPLEIIMSNIHGAILASEIIDSLISVINSRTNIDMAWAYGRRACVIAITNIMKIVDINLIKDRSRILDCIIRALDDYTVDHRGDVGRVLRESSMLAFITILPIMQQFPELSSLIDLAICKIVQQSCEKIDAIRQCAAHVINELLTINLQYIMEKETLMMVYSNTESVVGFKNDWEDSDWRRSVCFKRLAFLINSPHYRYYALRGFVISAGGLTESTKRGAIDALLSTISGFCSSIEELESFLDCLKKIFAENLGVSRITMSLLCTLEQIFADQLLSVFEFDPDSSPALRKIIELVITEMSMKGSPQKMKICLTVLSHLLHFNSNSLVWKKAASVIIRTLHSPLPTLRGTAAELLYEYLASKIETSSEENHSRLMNMLADTKWHAKDSEHFFVDASQKIASMMNVPPVKKKREGISNDSTVANNANDILAALENDSSHAVVVDEATVKRLVLQLEKRCLKNREMRIKYVEEPAKFMDSEVDLNEAVQEMHILATQPDLCKFAVESGLAVTLLQLLAHENSDIISATINLLQELVDINDSESEDNNNVASLIDALTSGQLIETLVQQSIERLDESVRDEADAIHNALSVVEAVLDYNPDYADKCVEQGLFTWLLRRGTQRSTLDANKMYASELLAVLLQTSELAQKRLTEKIDGFDLLLRALATYKRHDPASADEREHMENLFDAVCAALMYSPNRQKFLDGEGLQLMNLMLRERKQSRESALKVLDYAMNGAEGKENCAKFIEILGLRTLFPLFMRTPTKERRKDTTPLEHEEHVCSILASLLRSCGEDGRSRVLMKFAEHEYEKVDRAVELVLKYRERVDRFDARKAQSNSEEDSNNLYLDRLDAGLYTLQRIVLVLADVSVNGSSSCRNRAIKLFQMRTGNGKLSRHLIPVLEEYETNLAAEADVEKKRTRLLIARLSNLEKNR
ncbi:unnamed protein product [Dracunculus medinensis]|uniref:Beta-catenin-like protein 1 n=1 Tax=Dracunculus medinensis TaxID=318479 RepID=A0A158Q3E8_DRAME|nr:unnamed protein product [Dracunculus medinensis]